MLRSWLFCSLLLLSGCSCFMENNSGGTITRGVESCFDRAVDRVIENVIAPVDERSSDEVTAPSDSSSQASASDALQSLVSVAGSRQSYAPFIRDDRAFSSESR